MRLLYAIGCLGLLLCACTQDALEPTDLAIVCEEEAELVAHADEAPGSYVPAEALQQLAPFRLQIAEESLSSPSVRCTQDIVPAGVRPLSPAMRVAPAHLRSSVGFKLRLPLHGPAIPSGLSPQRLRIFWQPEAGGRVHTPPFADVQEQLELGFVDLKSHRLGTFQVGIEEAEVEPPDKLWRFRALAGISMGGGGAGMMGMQNPEAFDLILPLGSVFEWNYLSHYIVDYGLGGFCSGELLGELCDPPPVSELFEHGQSYEQWHYSDSGGDFDRDEYMTIFQDLSLTFGNLASYNPASPYLPAGLPASELQRSDAARCGENGEGAFTIPRGFYDDEYNPDGSLPVITFCDGETDNHRCAVDDDCISGECRGRRGDGRCRPTGRFDNEGEHPRPTEILLAVDVNGNGRRDSGEPVIRNTQEPFQDHGSDGVPNSDEPGYDPVTNPDPADDDYDWFANPTGTEGNWRWDVGEAYADVGLDGVADTATSPYDLGEGDGEFTISPNLARLLSAGPMAGLANTSDEALDQLTFYLDAGIRDLFNLAPSANHFVGALAQRGANVRIYDGFHSVANAEPDFYFQPHELQFDELGDHVYIRYGKRDATAQEIIDGDGKHVGSIVDAFFRLMTMLGFVANSFPDGDYRIVEPDARSEFVTFYSESLAADQAFSIVLPPGYDAPENAELRYPVVYFLHGYGMSPDDLQLTVDPFGGFMADGFWQKVIVVYPNGYCGNTERTQCNDGLDNDGDGQIDYDQGNIEACLDDGSCRRRGFRCDNGLCCPEGQAVCGLPDSDCAHKRHSNEGGSEAIPICADGVDNDLDGLTDHAQDRGCISATANNERDCRKGTFFVDHAAWPDGSTPGPRFGGALLDLIRHVDAQYRTRPAEAHPPR